MINIKTIVISVLCFIPIIGSARSVTLKQDSSVENQIQSVACKYIVKSDINLNGKTIRFMEGSTLIFKNGSLANGTIDGILNIKKNKKESLKVELSPNCRILNHIDIYSSANSGQLMAACYKGFTLKEDITISAPVRIKSNAVINGDGHKITSAKESAVCFYLINVHDVSFSNLTVEKNIEPGSINKNYAIFGENMSNISFLNCQITGRIQFTNKTQSDDDADISENVNFRDCTLSCNLSMCPQGWEYGQDHLAFFSVKNIFIENCSINSVDVNRVIKTSSYFPTAKFEKAVNCTDGVIFRNNTISASAKYGKQVWDMFCGTVNVSIDNNRFHTSGFSCVFEDKADQPKYKNGVLINSLISFTGNIITAENAGLFKFQANKHCDSFIFKNNTVSLCGKNLNSNTDQDRTTGVYLQGYKACKILDNEFNFTDEAVGLQFALVNFDVEDTEICNNDIYDSYRIYFAKSGGKNVRAETFKYSGNRRYYSDIYRNKRTEVSVAEASIQDLQIELCADNCYDTPLTFNKESDITIFNIDGKQGPLYEINSNDVRLGKTNQPSSVKRVGNKWVK